MSGVALPHGCRATHGGGATRKTPFTDMPLVMHELSAGGGSAFSGPLGFIPFTTAVRLPRHVHLGTADAEGRRALVAERILVLGGSGLVELAGTVWLAPPRSLFEIAAGVPHSWTACPAGIRLPDGEVTDGTFLMVYEYAEPTAFFPTGSTRTLASAADYEPYEGDVEAIKIAALSAEAVADTVSCVWDASIGRALRLA